MKPAVPGMSDQYPLVPKSPSHSQGRPENFRDERAHDATQAARKRSPHLIVLAQLSKAVQSRTIAIACLASELLLQSQVKVGRLLGSFLETFRPQTLLIV